MRVIAAILFLLGIPWALIAWVIIFGGPAAIVEEFQAGRTKDVLNLVLFWPLWAAHICLGYYVWARWLSITRDRSRSTRRFWLVASGHHLVWIVGGVIAYVQDNSSPPVILGYAVVVFCVCVLAAITTRPLTPAQSSTSRA